MWQYRNPEIWEARISQAVLVNRVSCQRLRSKGVVTDTPALDSKFIFHWGSVVLTNPSVPPHSFVRETPCGFLLEFRQTRNLCLGIQRGVGSFWVFQLSKIVFCWDFLDIIRNGRLPGSATVTANLLSSCLGQNGREVVINSLGFLWSAERKSKLSSSLKLGAWEAWWLGNFTWSCWVFMAWETCARTQKKKMRKLLAGCHTSRCCHRDCRRYPLLNEHQTVQHSSLPNHWMFQSLWSCDFNMAWRWQAPLLFFHTKGLYQLSLRIQNFVCLNHANEGKNSSILTLEHRDHRLMWRKCFCAAPIKVV